MNQPVTLITGTSKGIGRFLAEHYAGMGHQVVGCSRNPPGWSVPNYSHHCLDVTDEKAVVRLHAQIRAAYGRLDNLVNNAGIASMNHSLLTPGATVRALLDTNVVGSFLFCREAAKLMKNSHYGRIVNISSIAVRLKLEGEAAYAASKAAILSLTEVLAREFGVFGITVNAVGPTAIDTDLIRGIPPDTIKRVISRQAVPRAGTVEDVAHAIDFFLDPKSGFITGQFLFLGGL